MSLSRFCAFGLIIFLFVQCDWDDGPDLSTRPIPTNPNADAQRPFNPAADLNVVFVGNSLTYSNDLPSIVVHIAALDNVVIHAVSVVAGNYSLDDHWIDGTIQSTLTSNNYDYLIGQQGPSALPESQVLLKEAAIKIAMECEKHETKFALYMVWPSLGRDFDRDNSIKSYTNAAMSSGSLLCPAGLAWKLAWQKDKNLPLYGPDNFHPSLHGSVLAAITIYAAIMKKNDLTFLDKAKAGWPTISDAEFEIMKQAALDALK